jgi:ribose transport system ATP-binding protein
VTPSRDTTAGPDDEALLRCKVSKTYGDQRVLHDGALEIGPGEIHALVGQNGSGKSTLVKILAGVVDPDPGSVVAIGGSAVDVGDPSAVERAGVRFIHQDLGLIPELDVMSNLRLGPTYKAGGLARIDWKAEMRLARGNFEDLGLSHCDPAARIGSLSRAEQTEIAIVKAFRYARRPPRVVVLDEPTASLPGGDKARLFSLLRRFAAEGGGILYISHHLEEIFGVADSVTVLRDGEMVGRYRIDDIEHEDLVELMTGHKYVEQPTRRGTADVRRAGPRVVLEDLRGPQVESVSLSVGRGEIVGLAGLTGSGRSELLRILCGALEREDGHVTIDGEEVPVLSGVGQAMKWGIGYVPPDRTLAAIGQFTARENIGLTGLAHRRWTGKIRSGVEREEVDGWFDRMQIHPREPEKKLAFFSGGNQQKVVLAKWLRRQPRLFLIDEPTQGVDIGSKAVIHARLRELAQGGAAILMSSSDAKELADLSDEVLVVSDGRVAAHFEGGADLRPEMIVQAEAMARVKVTR